jgi:hypothetical protein
MVKRINVSISDDLYDDIQSAKQGFSKEFSVSKICQQALKDELEDAQARAYVWNTGFDDGRQYVESLNPEEQINIQKLISSFPRKYPDDLTELLMKAGFIELNNLEKLKTHLSILEHWKSVFKRFEFQENVDVSWFEKEGNVDLWEWGGRPAIHDGEEIWDVSADIRWEKIQQLWREGLIAGIKDATKSIEETPNEDE